MEWRRVLAASRNLRQINQPQVAGILDYFKNQVLPGAVDQLLLDDETPVRVRGGAKEYPTVQQRLRFTLYKPAMLRVHVAAEESSPVGPRFQVGDLVVSHNRGPIIMGHYQGSKHISGQQPTRCNPQPLPRQQWGQLRLPNQGVKIDAIHQHSPEFVRESSYTALINNFPSHSGSHISRLNRIDGSRIQLTNERT